MIRKACRQRKSSIELFHQKNPYHLMGERKLRKTDKRCCLLFNFGRKTISSSNDKSKMGSIVLLPIG